MVTLLIAIELHGNSYQLFFSDVFECYEVIRILVVLISTLRGIEETASGSALSTGHARGYSPIGNRGRVLGRATARYSLHLIIKVL